MTMAGWGLFLVFLVYQQILVGQFNMPQIYGYWDELFFLFLIGLSLFKWVKIDGCKIKLVDLLNISPWIFLILIGIIGNCLYKYALNFQPIVRDIIGCMKFSLGFYACRCIKIDQRIALSFKRKTIGWIKLIAVVICVCGFLSLFIDIGMSQASVRGGIHPYMFLFSHPTALVYSSVVVICLLNASERNNDQTLYIALLSAVIILTMRTKGIAFVAAFVFMRYSRKWMRNVKYLYWLGAIIAIFSASYSQLQMYVSWSDSGREVLYIGAFNLLFKCFPFGSGFGTYASHISGRYISGVYDFIYHYQFWNNDGGATAVLGDAGYPYYIGQFGVLGITLVIYGLYRLIKKNVLADKKYRFSAVLLLIYIGIALTSEAILITYGLELGILLAVLIRLEDMK